MLAIIVALIDDSDQSSTTELKLRLPNFLLIHYGANHALGFHLMFCDRDHHSKNVALLRLVLLVNLSGPLV